MKRYFVDTNILVDFIGDRKPFSKFALRLFLKAEIGEVQLYTSSHSIATTYYLIKKYVDEKKIREVLMNLLDYVEIIPIDKGIIKKGLLSKSKDFEDALQIHCAYTIENMDGIVTRNPKDFKDSNLPVFSPDDFS
jgi:predicted nucleic acid-binding protein